RTDGGARPGQRGLIGGHEGRRPGRTRQAHARKATAAEVIVGAAVTLIDPMLHIFREFHCFVTLRSASHGLVASLGSASPKLIRVLSGMTTMLVTVRPTSGPSLCYGGSRSRTPSDGVLDKSPPRCPRQQRAGAHLTAGRLVRQGQFFERALEALRND